MAKIMVNKDDVDFIIKNYINVDNGFIFVIKLPHNIFTRYKFILDGKKTYIDVYIRKDCLNILPDNGNVDIANRLINYIASKGMSADVKNAQLAIDCNRVISSEMISHVKNSFVNTITVENEKNKFTLIGHNMDRLIINQYDKKIVLQGKPLYVFSIIMDYLAQFLDTPIEEHYRNINNFLKINLPYEAIRENMKQKLGKSYDYLEEPILKSISGSLAFLEKYENYQIEDYTGCVTGVFKALEGYLKKILIAKYDFNFNSSSNFNMFTKKQGNFMIKNSQLYSDDENFYLSKLYTLYNNKRNTYLHSNVDPAMTAIIDNLGDAKSICDEIIETINRSYEVFLKST